MNLFSRRKISRWWFPLPLLLALGALLFFARDAVSQHHPSTVLVPAASSSAPTPDAANSPGSGSLRFSSVRPGETVDAPLLATDVRLEVTGPVVRAKVTQHFENPSEGWVEGVYVFPLPEQAAVDTLRVRVGDRFIEGQIKEREEAKQIYEQAKAAGTKTALVEQDRPNVFKTSVANIGPRETVIVQIEFQQTARFDAGRFSLRFPMVVAPRYEPRAPSSPSTGGGSAMANALPSSPTSRSNAGSSATAQSSALPASPAAVPVLHPDAPPRTNLVTCHVDLRAGFPLGDVQSSFHPMRLTRRAPAEADIELVPPVMANRDFELTWSPAAGSAPYAALFRERVGNEDYLLAFVVPPTLGVQPKPREAIFVIDNSGSMSGESIRQAKASLDLALERLTPNDTFNVIRFDDTMTQLFRSSVGATADNVNQARTYVRSLQASGGTEMLPALRAALQTSTSNTERVRQVMFLTDGAVTNEDEMFAEIGQHLGASRLYPIGIGSAPNSFFMARAARLGRGTFTHIGSGDQVQARTRALWTKIEAPVLTDLEAVLAGREIWPNPVPDLHTGEPVVLTVKGNPANAPLSLRGRLSSGSPWAADLQPAQAVAGTGIGKLWARSKIESVEEKRFLRQAPTEQIDQEVKDVALAFHLVSRRTSLVAVDITPSRPAGEPLQKQMVPVHLPAGWDFDAVFGALPSRGSGLVVGSADVASSPQPPQALSAVGDETASVDLPGTATSMELLAWQGAAWCVVALALFFARRYVVARAVGRG